MISLKCKKFHRHFARNNEDGIGKKTKKLGINGRKSKWYPYRTL